MLFVCHLHSTFLKKPKDHPDDVMKFFVFYCGGYDDAAAAAREKFLDSVDLLGDA